MNECDWWMSAWLLKNKTWVQMNVESSQQRPQFVTLNTVCSDKYGLFWWIQFVPMNEVCSNECSSNECRSKMNVVWSQARRMWFNEMSAWMNEWTNPTTLFTSSATTTPTTTITRTYRPMVKRQGGRREDGRTGERELLFCCFSVAFPLFFRCFSAALSLPSLSARVSGSGNYLSLPLPLLLIFFYHFRFH